MILVFFCGNFISHTFINTQLLYTTLKIAAKLAFLLYCRTIRINDKKYLSAEGPLLIASNHPNSFLDAIIIATLFKKPVYSLTRGDMYKNKFFARILLSLKMLPVYRISEGAENMDQNYKTFDKCKDIFKKNGIVLIFSEGLCINEWQLRPLKKGTARLAISSWQDGIGLKILPVGINYQAFQIFGKNIEINFGDIINEEDIDHTNGYGKTISDFNEKLKDKLHPLVAQIEKNNKQEISARFYAKQGWIKKILLFIPALFGWLFHVLLYNSVKYYTWKKAGHTGHYDSIIIAMLFGFYPFYLLGFAIWVSFLKPGPWWICVFFILPFCAWSYLQLKRQFKKY